jgi:hypothetical protein
VDFGALLEPNFESFFGPFRALNFPVLLGFLRLASHFWALFGRVLDRTFGHHFWPCSGR